MHTKSELFNQRLLSIFCYFCSEEVDSIIKLIKGETGNSRFRLPYALKKLIGFLASQSPAFCSTMSNFALDVILKKFEGLRDVLLLNYLLTLTSAKNIFIETSLA